MKKKTKISIKKITLNGKETTLKNNSNQFVQVWFQSLVAIGGNGSCIDPMGGRHCIK
ncbi:MAG TPA: hypothetical protein VGO58_04645 [Chitinophagaceae bacterium]|jgi:hypothetical protein|nr:hypothetical protein [Chitinophagaceae bacterium]